MKMNICDVCYYESGMKKIELSRYRLTHKNKLRGLSLSLDVCDQHKDFLKGCKTFEESQKKVDELYGFQEVK